MRNISCYEKERIDNSIVIKFYKTKGILFRFFKPWLGDGLLISNGQKWYSHRKIIAPAFHISVLKSFVPLFYENSWTLVKRLRDQVGKEFDCHDYLSAITVDILMETAMGVRGIQKEKNSFDYAMAVMKYIFFYYYARIFDHVIPIFI